MRRHASAEVNDDRTFVIPSVMSIRLGTRASPLARWQAEWVAAQLRGRGIEVELVPITTTGDRRRGAIEEIGGRGVFTKEIQLALLEGRIDLAVHSLKDLPTAATPGLSSGGGARAGAAGRRPGSAAKVAGTRRVPLSAHGVCGLQSLPPGAAIGTGSLRRRAQLLHFRRDLQMKDIRGNVDTRLRKLHEGGYDALLLAEAGLRRLGLAHEIAQAVPLEIVLPAAGQGALGLETRTEDASARRIVAPLDHPPTHAAVRAERALLAALEGGCLAPVAALGRVDGDRLTLTGRVIGHDGAQMLEARQDAPAADAEILGRRVAEDLAGPRGRRVDPRRTGIGRDVALGQGCLPAAYGVSCLLLVNCGAKQIGESDHADDASTSPAIVCGRPIADGSGGPAWTGAGRGRRTGRRPPKISPSRTSS